jgi:hypothetical protein
MRLSKIASAVLDPYIQDKSVIVEEYRSGIISLLFRSDDVLNDFVLQCKKEKVKRKEKEKDKK